MLARALALWRSPPPRRPDPPPRRPDARGSGRRRRPLPTPRRSRGDRPSLASPRNGRTPRPSRAGRSRRPGWCATFLACTLTRVPIYQRLAPGAPRLRPSADGAADPAAERRRPENHPPADLRPAAAGRRVGRFRRPRRPSRIGRSADDSGLLLWRYRTPGLAPGRCPIRKSCRHTQKCALPRRLPFQSGSRLASLTGHFPFGVQCFSQMGK